MSDTKKCEHPACSCITSDHDKYCSQYCKDAGESTEISCDCGHSGCSLADAPVR